MRLLFLFLFLLKTSADPVVESADVALCAECVLFYKFYVLIYDDKRKIGVYNKYTKYPLRNDLF